MAYNGPPPPAATTPGTPLPPTLQHELECRSLAGTDLSNVRVHQGHQATHVGAVAYAQGNNLYLAPGQEHHLPHEAWHVVQQRQGRVGPPTNPGLVQL